MSKYPMNLSQEKDDTNDINVDIQIDFAKDVFTNCKEFISIADSKANLTLTIQTILISVGLAAPLVYSSYGAFDNLEDKAMYFFYGLFMIFIISISVGIFTSIMVYRARVEPLSKTENYSGNIFYKGVIESQSSNNYLKRVRTLSSEQILEEYSRQSYIISEIIDVKMKWVNRSTIALFVNMALTIIIVLISAIIGISSS
jgi:hypothetical protein